MHTSKYAVLIIVLFKNDCGFIGTRKLLTQKMHVGVSLIFECESAVAHMVEILEPLKV